MKFQTIVTLCLLSAALNGCKETATTPTLPPMNPMPVSRPAAAIQNTEVMDQSIMNAAQGNN